MEGLIKYLGLNSRGNSALRRITYDCRHGCVVHDVQLLQTLLRISIGLGSVKLSLSHCFSLSFSASLSISLSLSASLSLSSLCLYLSQLYSYLSLSLLFSLSVSASLFLSLSVCFYVYISRSIHHSNPFSLSSPFFLFTYALISTLWKLSFGQSILQPS
jgi:hypothetical protein